MPKIEAGSATGKFLIDGKIYSGGQYQVTPQSSDLTATDTQITIHPRGFPTQVISSGLLSTYTDDGDAGFADIAAFYTYLDGFFFDKTSTGGGTSDAIQSFPQGVQNPTVSLVGAKKTDRAITLTEVEVLLIGATNATLEARFGPTVTAGGGTLIGASATYAVGQNDITITTAAVPSGNYVWFEITALTGTPTLLTLNYTY